MLVDVGVCAPGGELSDLAVAVAGDAEGEVLALAFGEFGEAAQCSAGFDGVVERDGVGDRVFPSRRGGSRSSR